jgi:hypothetical protein
MNALAGITNPFRETVVTDGGGHACVARGVAAVRN